MSINKTLLRAMLHSPVRNYAIPGMTSWLVGNPSPAGTVRFFECSRDHQENITPHSHRFNFQCCVLAGEVINRVWRPMPNGDEFEVTRLNYSGEIGRYEKVCIGTARYRHFDAVHKQGDWYEMQADQIHSIDFSRGAEVLFLEGPSVSDHSIILEPHVDGERIPTFKVEPWMFKKGVAA